MAGKPIVYQVVHQGTGHFVTGKLSGYVYASGRGKLWFSRNAAAVFAARLRYVTSMAGIAKPPLKVVEYQLIEVE